MKLRTLMGTVDAQRFAPIGALIMANLQGQAQVEQVSAKEVKELSDIAVASLINGGAIRGDNFFMIDGELITTEKPMVIKSTKEEVVVEEVRDLNKEIESLEKQIHELESVENAFKKADEIATIIERRVNDGQVVEAHLKLLGNLLLEKTEGFDLESLVVQIKDLRSQRQALKKTIKTEEEIRAKAEEEAEAKAKAEAKAEKEMMKVIKTIIISDVAKLSHTSEESVKEFSLLLKRRVLAAHARQCKAVKKEAEAEAKKVAEAKAEAQAKARTKRAAKKAARKAARIQKNGCLLLEKTLKCLKAGATNYDQVASMLKQARKHHLKLEVYIGLMDTINEISDKYDLTMRCVWNVFWSKKRELGFSLKDNLQDIVDLVLHKIELHCNPTSFIAPIKKVVKKVTNVIVDIRKVIYQHKNGKYIRYTY